MKISWCQKTRKIMNQVLLKWRIVYKLQVPQEGIDRLKRDLILHDWIVGKKERQGILSCGVKCWIDEEILDTLQSIEKFVARDLGESNHLIEHHTSPQRHSTVQGSLHKAKRSQKRKKISLMADLKGSSVLKWWKGYSRRSPPSKECMEVEYKKCLLVGAKWAKQVEGCVLPNDLGSWVRNNYSLILYLAQNK